jgi:hypothetical protein
MRLRIVSEIWIGEFERREFTDDAVFELEPTTQMVTVKEIIELTYHDGQYGFFHRDDAFIEIESALESPTWKRLERVFGE